MADSQIKIEGLKQFQDRLKNLPRKLLLKAGRGMVQAAAQPIADEYQANIAKRTGKTARTIKVRVGRNVAAYTVSVRVGSRGKRAHIARYLELGTVKMAPRGDLRRAFDSKRAEYERNLAAALKHVIPELAKHG